MHLLDYIPLYSAHPESAAMQAGYQAACEGLWADLKNLYGEGFIDTARRSLTEWEALYGLEIREDSSPERRRERVRARMRGSGTTTVALIESVARSFSNGEVTVIEHNSEYYFEVVFVSQQGRPPGLDALKEAVEDVKPAHLGVIYTFTMVTHGAIRRAPYTHAELAAYKHLDVREVLQVEEDE